MKLLNCVLPPLDVLALMAILVNASSSCLKQLLPWTVFCVEDDWMTLDGCFEMVVSKNGPVI